MHINNFTKIIRYILPIIVFLLLYIVAPNVAKASVGDNIFGNAWSDNVGWISFNNCENPGLANTCGAVSYGVKTTSLGVVSGNAWNDNVGWISFNPADWGSCPPSGSCTNVSTYSNKWASGWARVLSMKTAGSNNGGADGWIHFSNTSPSYGGVMGSTNVASSLGNLFSGTGVVVHSATGYWWGSKVVGWIDLSPSSSIGFSSGGVFDCVSCTTPPTGPIVTLTPSTASVLSGNTVDFSWTVSPSTFIPVKCEGVGGSTNNTDWSGVNFGTASTASGIHVNSTSSGDVSTNFSIKCTDASSVVATSVQVSVLSTPLTATLSYGGSCMQNGSPNPSLSWSTNDTTASCRIEATTFGVSPYYLPASGAYNLSGSTSSSGTSGTISDNNFNNANTNYKLSCTNGTGIYETSKLSAPATSVNMCTPNYSITGSGMCQGAIGATMAKVNGSNPVRYEGSVDLTLNPLYNFMSSASVSGSATTGSLVFTPNSGFSYLNSIFNTVSAKLILSQAEYSALASTISNGILQSINISVAGSSQNVNPKTVTLNFCPVPPPSTCTIDSYYSSAQNVQAKDTVELHWSTSNCTDVSINNGVGAVTPVSSGYEVVTVYSTTKYEITASDGTNVDTKELTVAVDSPPPKVCTITSFAPTLGTIAYGSTSGIEWTTANCTGVTIDGSVILPSNSTSPYIVSPTTTTTYTLTATNATTSDTALAVITVDITIPTTCTIDAFYSSASNISIGKSSELHYKTSNCTTASIDQGVPPIAVSGGVYTVSPTNSTIYTLTASDGATSVTSSVTISVTIIPLLTCNINSFIPNPGTIVPPATSSTLEWDTSNCSTVTITGITTSTSSAGSFTVYPISTTTYNLTANGVGGMDTAVATVTLGSNTCAIDDFYADQTHLTYGDSTVLNWKTTNCTTLSINPSVSTIPIPNTTGSSNTGPIWAGKSYVLTASDGINPPVTKNVNITVGLFVCKIDVFKANPSASLTPTTSTLTFTTSSSCTSATIDGGTVSNASVSSSLPSGTYQITTPISATTVYKITANDTNGTAVRTATVSIGVSPGVNIKPKYKPF